MTYRTLKKEDIDKVRAIEGFPIGTDEDIINLSNAPFYTVCPNPFIKEFIDENGNPYVEDTDVYSCDAFTFDVTEGKTDPLYMAHTYHTKVPYKAIMRYILHYTNPGDIVLDGFSGTGMTGVAAQKCGQLTPTEEFAIKQSMENVEFGERKAVLNDLSPMATFISHNYNSAIDLIAFKKDLENLLDTAQADIGWIYETNHDDGTTKDLSGQPLKGKINYTIWSDVLICGNCSEEFTFWDIAVTPSKTVEKTFVCTNCNQKLKKTDCSLAMDSIFDDKLNKTIKVAKQKPVEINYTFNNKKYTKKPDNDDLALIDKINKMKIPHWFPIDEMPKGSESSRNNKTGITNVHQFFTKRNLFCLSYLYEKINDDNKMLFLFTSIMQRASKLFKWNKNQAGPMSGTLYISSLVYETSVFSLIKNKQKLFDTWSAKTENTMVSCGSTGNLATIPENSIDYIFTDPPFGDNIMYSELSFIWESWLKIKTNTKSEAIMNKHQNKTLTEYHELMTSCFKEYFRVLKPNRWLTVEFHNSKNAVWNTIQDGLQKSGFIVADVRTLDKKQGSFKQVNSDGAVKQDLVISAYKPKESFITNFINKAGTNDTAWDFVTQHLENIPVVVINNDEIEIISERQNFLLFDRMVAYHIIKGIPVPIDATDFYVGLDQKFEKRDDMYFLLDQVNEYDTTRIKTKVEVIQFELFVTNEKSAIAWLYKQLSPTFCGPQKYSELQPKFMQETKSKDRFETIPELQVLLDENFLQNSNKEWYIPDITEEADVKKLREKKLLKEFEGYLDTKGKLKSFRSEAIRVGFSKLWTDSRFQEIVDIAERLPEITIQEDPNLLMYYDISLDKIK